MKEITYYIFTEKIGCCKDDVLTFDTFEEAEECAEKWRKESEDINEVIITEVTKKVVKRI